MFIDNQFIKIIHYFINVVNNKLLYVLCLNIMIYKY